MVNSTRKVCEQVSYSIDVKQSLQKLYSKLENKESNELLLFLNYSYHNVHSNMTKITYGYAIGCMKTCDLSPLHFIEVKKLCEQVPKQAKMFERLLYNDMILHTSNYRNSEGKRKSCYCSYLSSTGNEMFGEIEQLAECSSIGTVLFIKPFLVSASNILETSGLPCRPILDHYANLGLISQFILPLSVTQSTTPVCISASNIVTNCILVKTSTTNNYIIKIPNNYEHH